MCCCRCCCCCCATLTVRVAQIREKSGLARDDDKYTCSGATTGRETIMSELFCLPVNLNPLKERHTMLTSEGRPRLLQRRHEVSSSHLFFSLFFLTPLLLIPISLSSTTCARASARLLLGQKCRFLLIRATILSVALANAFTNALANAFACSLNDSP